jgi:hypothetical protein
MKKIMLIFAVLVLSAHSIAAENKFVTFYNNLKQLFTSLDSKDNVKNLLAKPVEKVKSAVNSASEGFEDLLSANEPVKPVQLNLSNEGTTDPKEATRIENNKKKLNDALERAKKKNNLFKKKHDQVMKDLMDLTEQEKKINEKYGIQPEDSDDEEHDFVQALRMQILEDYLNKK